MEPILPGIGINTVNTVNGSVGGSKGGVGEGELWIGGIGVAAGYLNATDLTKEVRQQQQFHFISFLFIISVLNSFIFYSFLNFILFNLFKINSFLLFSLEISWNMTMSRDNHITSQFHRNSFRIPLGKDLFTAQETL